MFKVLLVDDDQGFVDATTEIIEMLGHSVNAFGTIESAVAALQRDAYDILLMDIMLPDGNGFDILEKISKDNRPSRIAFITGHSSIKSLIKKVAGPGISYLLKPISLASIQSLLDLPDQSNISTDGVEKRFGVLVGESPEMQSIYEMIERVSGSQANVMIQGESGTGKELVAQAIHYASQPDGDFVAANCGAIMPELIGSELFGHEKGAFTGAISKKIGLFERANNGTLFLDEITEMPIALQPTLLRVLETGKITRVGGSQEIPVNCRVVSATNRTREELAEGKFLREDIYFRLAVFPLELPPLKNRKDDIPLLVEYFLSELNEEHDTKIGIDDVAMKKLCDNEWPGNVRELRHALYRAFILTGADEKFIKLPEQLSSPFSKKQEVKTGLTAGKTIQEMEKELIAMTLEKVDGDKPLAAEMLGISLKTLYNRINQYEQI